MPAGTGDPTTLLYQVFTTTDGTQNNPVRRGRHRWPLAISAIPSGMTGSLRIIISISRTSVGANSVLITTTSGSNADNDRGKRVKVISLIHGNQAIQPGSVMQKLINNGASARLLPRARRAPGVCAFRFALTCHADFCLRDAMGALCQSLGADDGPAFNTRIGSHDRRAARSTC